MNLKDNLYKNQRRIGLTGGIASGKSTIAEYILRNKKIKILDADDFSKRLISPEEESYERIINHYGNGIINNNSAKKEIITSKLRNIIFNDLNEKKWLENLLHPLVKSKMIQACNNLYKEKIIILVIPLLFEANFNDLCTEIWLVKCSKKTQQKRLMGRDQITKDYANKIINSQMSFHKKAIRSDFILLNENANDMNIWKTNLQNLL